MHDISVAQVVVDTVIKELEGKDFSRIEIDLVVGELRFHDTEQVDFWIKELLKENFKKNIEVKTRIEVVKPKINCKCGYIGEVKSDNTHDELAHHGLLDLNCPQCNSHEIALEKGNECILKRITYE